MSPKSVVKYVSKKRRLPTSCTPQNLQTSSFLYILIQNGRLQLLAEFQPKAGKRTPRAKCWHTYPTPNLGGFRPSVLCPSVPSCPSRRRRCSSRRRRPSSVRPSRRVRPVVAVIVLCPSVPSSVLSSSSVLCPSVSSSVRRRRPSPVRPSSRPSVVN